jgi:hypothetical protein
MKNDIDNITCWKRLNCCRRRTKKSESTESVLRTSTSSTQIQKKGKIRLCIDRFLCCRKNHKVDQSDSDMRHANDDDEEVKTCCCCFKCKRKKKPQKAWQTAQQRRDTKMNEDIQP